MRQGKLDHASSFTLSASVGLKPHPKGGWPALQVHRQEPLQDYRQCATMACFVVFWGDDSSCCHLEAGTGSGGISKETFTTQCISGETLSQKTKEKNKFRRFRNIAWWCRALGQHVQRSRFSPQCHKTKIVESASFLALWWARVLFCFEIFAFTY